MARRCLSLLAALLLVQQAFCYPHYWVFPEHSGTSNAPTSAPACTALPTQAWGEHGGVIKDPDVLYKILRNGQAVTKVCPGTKYTLQVSFPAPRFSVIVATNTAFIKPYAGLDTEIDAREKPCPQRIIMDSLTNENVPTLSESQSADFIVDCGATGKVSISSSSSSMAMDGFHEATVTIPIDATCATTACSKTAATTTTTTPKTTTVTGSVTPTTTTKPATTTTTTTPTTTTTTKTKTGKETETETEDHEGHEGHEDDGGKGDDGDKGRGRGRGGDDGGDDGANSGSYGSSTGSSSSGTSTTTDKGTAATNAATSNTASTTTTAANTTTAAATAANSAASATILKSSGKCNIALKSSGSCSKSDLGYSCGADLSQQMAGMSLHWQVGGCVPDNVCTKTYTVKNSAIPINSEMLHMAVQMPTNGYVGLAFATNIQRMADSDGIIGWVDASGNPVINSYPIRGHAVSQVSAYSGTNQFLSHASVSNSGGTTTICFSRPLAHQGAQFSPTLDPNSDLKLIYARGGTKGLANHNAQGGMRVPLQTGTIQAAKRVWWPEVHGVLMTVAWVGLVPFAILSSRRRGVYGSKQTCGADNWFHLHRLAALLGVAAFAGGLAVAFVKLEEGSGSIATAHSKLAWILIAAVIIQVLLGIFRLPKTHQYRSMWENSHHFLGYLSVAAGLSNVFLGLKLYHDTKQHSITVWAIVAAAMIVAWIILDVLLWSKFGKKKQEGVVFQGPAGTGKVMPPPHVHDVHNLHKADQQV